MAHRFKAVLLAASAGLLAVSGVAGTTGAIAQSTRSEAARPMADAAYWNASLPVEQRVADLLARMTLEEKIAQITTVWTNKTQFQDAQNRFDPAIASIRPRRPPPGLTVSARSPARRTFPVPRARAWSAAARSRTASPT
jgi:hypothetical protein